MKHRRAAQREGFDDVLFLNPDGTISEIATSNIGFVRGEQIVWPRSECLSGVTMTLFRQALDESVTKEPITISDLSDMDAALATNAATGIDRSPPWTVQSGPPSMTHCAYWAACTPRSPVRRFWALVWVYCHRPGQTLDRI